MADHVPTSSLPSHPAYVPPTVERLGTLADLTQGAQFNSQDGFGGTDPFSIPP